MEDEAVKMDGSNTPFSCRCIDVYQSYTAQDEPEQFAAQLNVYGLYENLRCKKEQDELLDIWKI